MNYLLEFGIERLQEVSKRWKQNFEGLIIDKEGNIETDDSEEKYVHEGEPETGIKNIILKVSTRNWKPLDYNLKSAKRQKRRVWRVEFTRMRYL